MGKRVLRNKNPTHIYQIALYLTVLFLLRLNKWPHTFICKNVNHNHELIYNLNSEVTMVMVINVRDLMDLYNMVQWCH